MIFRLRLIDLKSARNYFD